MNATEVKTAIVNEPTLRVSGINVEAFKGVVQLSGFVRGAADIRKAARVVRDVKGIKAVKNEFRAKRRKQRTFAMEEGCSYALPPCDDWHRNR